ncbi:F-box/LRR-repeat protein 20, related [Neospora caninum Liverpool]|uniref:F-box/LRR-repeat protein 20, related n=1 Tax=Neospora caninum (strain Liverpool) TaxID=572307 RepID=F0VG99_NEOCL|nr:F-box/LRR-repeat protein 20, related [Neospora caninum Liverpool]CBZ52743.1 F-box/LRR-repeat protein 20, related [Neospora caninum Liverpool]|eukprot:XP_003882775.1 F-box/LRR-repeat protein 20, related [Neospora caninum Liverpool]
MSRRSWHPALNAVFSKTVVSLGTSRRLLLTDAQLEALLKRCPEVHTVELDCFLLTPRGAGRLGTAPNLKSLSLTSVDHQTDAFFYALAAAVPDLDSFSIAIFDRSKHITNAALEHLAGRLRKLQAFSVEFSFRENLDFFVLALTTASLHTLRHVALHDVSQDCLVQLTAAVGKNLLSFSYTNFTRMSDGFLHEVLVACAGSNVSAAPPASVSSPRASTLSPSSASPPLRGPSGASGFKLKKLSLEAADISDLGLHAIATALGNTAETLCLKRCSSLSEAGHSAIAEYCRNLTSLNLGFCSGVNDLSVCCLLQSCPSLRTLVLNDARISDVALKAIGDCLGENLFELALHRSDKITNEGLRVLARACPNLVLLSLSSCSQVTDAGVVEIAESCRRLLKLRLDGTRVTDVAIRAVGQSLRRLRYLHLQRCSHVTGESLSFFSAETHPCLKCIELSESRRKVSKDQIRAFRERNRPATALLLGEAATGD